MSTRLLITAQFYTDLALRDPPPQTFEKIPSFPGMIFLAVDTQTLVLVSTAKVWISAPDDQISVVLDFLGIHSGQK